MRTKLFTLAALLLTPLAAICGGAEATLPAKPDASSKKTQNFLFIGNSFTMARDILRANYYSRRTEEVYLGWMRRFILFHGKQHPRDLREPAVTARRTPLLTPNTSESAFGRSCNKSRRAKFRWLKAWSCCSAAPNNARATAPEFSSYPSGRSVSDEHAGVADSVACSAGGYRGHFRSAIGCCRHQRAGASPRRRIGT